MGAHAPTSSSSRWLGSVWRGIRAQRRGDVDQLFVGGADQPQVGLDNRAAALADRFLSVGRSTAAMSSIERHAAFSDERRDAQEDTDERRALHSARELGRGAKRSASASESSATTLMPRRDDVARARVPGWMTRSRSGSVSDAVQEEGAAVDQAGQRISLAERDHVVQLARARRDAARCAVGWAPARSSGSRSSAGRASRSRSADTPARTGRTVHRRRSPAAC